MKLLGILVTVLAACSSHRASMPAGSTSLLPVFTDPGELLVAIAVTPLTNRTEGFGMRLAGRLDEHVALGFVGEAGLSDTMDALHPAIVLAPELMLSWDPFRFDLSAGLTQSSFFIAARAGVADTLRSDDGRVAARFAASVFGGLPGGASCGGELVSCTHGPTQRTFGIEGSVVASARAAGVELALGPQVGVVWPSGEASVYYGLVLQLELAVDVKTQTFTRAAP